MDLYEEGYNESFEEYISEDIDNNNNINNKIIDLAFPESDQSTCSFKLPSLNFKNNKIIIKNNNQFCSSIIFNVAGKLLLK